MSVFFAAVAAMPEGHKASEYLETANRCAKELNRRERIRRWRARVAINTDRFFSGDSRLARKNKGWATYTYRHYRQDAWDAAWNLGWHKLHCK